jgi:hypothetical protein
LGTLTLLPDLFQKPLDEDVLLADQHPLTANHDVLGDSSLRHIKLLSGQGRLFGSTKGSIEIGGHTGSNGGFSGKSIGAMGLAAAPRRLGFAFGFFDSVARLGGGAPERGDRLGEASVLPGADDRVSELDHVMQRLDQHVLALVSLPLTAVALAHAEHAVVD